MAYRTGEYLWLEDWLKYCERIAAYERMTLLERLCLRVLARRFGAKYAEEGQA